MVVQGVSSEPVSLEFPVKQGKNREFSQNQPRIADLYGLSSWVLWLFLPNSLNDITGNIFGRTGNFWPGTGNLRSPLRSTRRSRAVSAYISGYRCRMSPVVKGCPTPAGRVSPHTPVSGRRPTTLHDSGLMGLGPGPGSGSGPEARLGAGFRWGSRALRVIDPRHCGPPA